MMARVFILLLISVFCSPAAPRLLSPRQAAIAAHFTLAPGSNRVDYVMASKVINGTLYRWHGLEWQTNLDRLVVLDLTNKPAPPASRVVISWDEPVTLLTSSDLSAWAPLTATSTRSVIVPVDAPSKFFRVPVPDHVIHLAWDPSPDFSVVGYNVYYGTNAGSYGSLIDAHDTTQLAIDGLAPGVTYFMAATAYDSSRTESMFSNEVTVEVVPREPVVTIQTHP